MDEFGIITSFIYLIFYIIVLILSILLIFCVFSIRQESIKSNKLLEQLISCVLDPKEAAKTIQNPDKIRQLQESYRKRRK